MIFDNHDIVEQEGVIEKYILGKLSEKDENAFEEHLLFCRECREKYQTVKKVLDATQSKMADEVFGSNKSQTSKHNSPKYFFFKIAAGIIIFIGLAGVIFVTMKTPKSHKNIAGINDSVNIMSDTNTNKSLLPGKENKEIKPVETSKINGDEQIAQAFIVLPYLESEIENQLRAGAINVISPVNSIEFEPGSTILFNWKSETYKQLTLVIRSNTGKIIVETEVQPLYKTSEIKHPGLYYWQLNSNDETLHCGKFFVRESNN
jgi:hypothetical protein